MSNAAVIQVEALGKKYLIAHRAKRERYVALRDVMARSALSAFRKAADMVRRRAIDTGHDTVEEFWALKDISFEVTRGEVVAIIGRNGAGKSTLLKILSRITEPTKGRVTIRGRVASLLDVGTGFHPELTGRENIYLNGAILSMTRAEIKRRFDEIVNFAEIDRFLDTPVKRYSSGMYVRLAFAVAAHLEPEILIVDEVLAVGDAEFQQKCIAKMSAVAGGGRTVLVVSHNLHSVSSLCGRGIVLAQGELLVDSTIDQAISAYTSLAARNPSSNHVLYVNADLDEISDASVTCVEMLDHELKPKPSLASGEAVVFRVWFRCRSVVPQGSVALTVRAPTGPTLAKFETDPRRIDPMKRTGDHFVDCRIHSLPFMQGQYLISVGLVQYGIRFDWKADVVTINVRDISDPKLFMNGDNEGALIISHQWEVSTSSRLDGIPQSPSSSLLI
jgi:lipopolysaccharide transport system ATP-binding protein